MTTISTIITYLPGNGVHAFPSTAFAANDPNLVEHRDEFVIHNPNSGPTQGYSIHLFSDVGEDSVGDFTYLGGVPQGGTITRVEIWAPGASKAYATFAGSFHDKYLFDFWTVLKTNGPDGPRLALDNLVGDNATVYGSIDGDQVETYGRNADYSRLGTGNDFLHIFDSIIFPSITYAVGGAGNDTFQIEKSGLVGLDLHGGQSNGTVAPGEVNTIDFYVAGTLAFQNIDGFTSFQFTAPGDNTKVANFDQFIYFNTDQLPGGTAPVFHVTGGDAQHANEIVIEPSPGDGPENIDLRNVTVSNFTTRFDQAFWFDFTGDKFNDTAFGATNARNVFHFGSGNDHAIGGNLADVFFGGHGNDTFNGLGGIDVAHYDGNRGQYTVTKINAHIYRVHDNRHGSPEGTDTLVNVEYLKFANKAVLIGTLPHSSAISALHTHDLAAAHHFDLFV